MTFYQFALTNIRRNFNSYIAYFLSSIFSVTIFFSFAICMFHPTLINSYEKIGNVTFIMLLFSEIIISLFSFLFILYSLSTFLKLRMQDFGILTILGASQFQLKSLILIENLLVGFFSIIIGIIFGLAFCKFFLLLSSNIIGINMYFYFPRKAIIITIVLFSFLFFVVSLFCSFIIPSKKVTKLLKIKEESNKYINYSSLLSILSIFLILLGYFISYFSEYFKNFNNYIPLILMLITIGTYLFYSQFSILVINKLKLNKKFYMKKTNILWISDLSYRIKKNAHMLFLITIIFSAAFTTISSLYILNYNQDSRIITYFPFTISYLSLDKNIEEKNHVSIIENTLNNSNEKYNKCKLSIIKEEVMDEDYYIIKLADFNKILNTLKSNKIFLTPIKLNKNETYLISNYNKKHYIKTLLDKKSIWLKDNITLKVKGVSNRNIFPLGILSNSIVVEDSLYDSIKNNYSNITFYGYVVPEWKNNLSSISSLNNKIHRKYKDSFIFLTSSDVYEYDKFQSSLQLFIGFFIGAIFLIGAGSFLYFKFYVDINEDKNKYKNISKLGLTNNEIKTSITIQTFILFFVPYFISIFHTFFALKCLQGVLSYPIKIRFFFIWISFFIIHFIYFLKIRSKYIKKLLKYTI